MVDALSVLIGIDDDLSWRGSEFGDLFGDNIVDWFPDGDPNSAAAARFTISHVENLHRQFAAVIEDGHELMDIYIEGARRRGLAAFASLRMNDARTSDEARCWLERSRFKLDRQHLLIGSPLPSFTPGSSEQWRFSWQWDYAHDEVRQRVRGLIEEVITRCDFDGVELDFCRQPPYFRAGQAIRNIDTMTDFVRRVRQAVARRGEARGRNVTLAVRVPPSIDESLEWGFDTETWVREALADIVILGSLSLCEHEFDVARAVACASDNGVRVYTGFDGGTRPISPQEGYEIHVPSVLRAAADNGYRHGASGVYVFNYDYPGHRALPADRGGFNQDHLQTLRDLADPAVLGQRQRCFAAKGDRIGGNVNYAAGDQRPQLPRRLAVAGRGAGARHAVHLTIADDVSAGQADGRISRTELRLRLSDHEQAMDRIRCEINGRALDLSPSGSVSNGQEQTWMIFDSPPLRVGDNSILLMLDGVKTPDPWPVLGGCEVVVFGRD